MFLLDKEFVEGGCGGGDEYPKSKDSSVSDFSGSSATMKNCL